MGNDHNETGDHTDDSVESMKILNPGVLVLSASLSLSCIIIFTNILILGTVSWIKIKPWRQFKNYVFLNIILSLYLMNIAYLACFSDWPCCGPILTVTYRVAMSAFANWVLIMCMINYTKILKVFSGNLQHKYLKANAFAWGLAAIGCVFPLQPFVTNVPNVTIYVLHTMTYVIVGFYFSIIYALLKLTTVRMVSIDNSFQIMKMFIYVTSAFCILILMQALYYFSVFYDIIFLGICFCEIILVFSFFTMKTHWDMWDEHLNGKINYSNGDEILIEVEVRYK